MSQGGRRKSQEVTRRSQEVTGKLQEVTRRLQDGHGRLWAGYRVITGGYEVVMYYHSKARPKITSSRFLVQFNIMIYSMINNISEHLVIDIDKY